MSDTTSAPPSSRRQAPPFGASERMIALRYLGATKKGRGVSFISVIGFAGIALSVATLIVVMSVMQGFRTTLLDQLLGVNGHVYVMTTEENFSDYEGVAARAGALRGVTEATPVMRVAAGATNGERLVPLDLIGIEPDALRQVKEVAGEGRVLAGGFEGFGAGRKGGNEIALAVGVASQLGVTAGDTITIIVAGGAETPFGTEPFEEKAYRVGAVFKIGNSQYDAIRAYLPLEQARLLTRGRGDMQVEIRIEDPQNPRPLREAVAGVAGPYNYVLDWTDLNKSYFDALQIERSMVRIILSLLVLVATLLIVSNLVMRVKDKTADIAVLRTMGATRAAVMRIFFLSGMLIGLMGTVIGVALGVAVTLNITEIERALSTVLKVALFNPDIYFLERIPAELQWAEIAFVVSWTLVLSAAASLLPAWKAARLDPVEALRYE